VVRPEALTVAVFLDIEKAFYTTWHSGLLYKLSEFEFSASLIKLSERKFKAMVEDQFSTPRGIVAVVPKVQSLPEYCTVYLYT
jgi:hypothetical protein